MRSKRVAVRVQPPTIPNAESVGDFVAFESWVRSLPLAQRGPVWERFVEAYLCLTSALGIRDLWRPGDPYLPGDVLAALGLDRQDVGQDFVARTTSGALWVVQAKFRSAAASLTWQDVRGAVAAGRRAARVLVISNARSISRQAPRGILNAHVGTVLRDALIGLGNDFFEAWERTRAGQAPQRREAAAPRPYQEDAIADVLSAFDAGASRAQLIAACGTGKTLMGLWIVEQLACSRVAFFAPSLALVSQTIAEWTAAASTPIDVLCVCSDPDAGDLSAYELAVPVTTSATDLHAQWTAPLTPGARRVIFATYQSAAVVRDALRIGGTPSSELVICDEAHRVAGDQDKAWQIVLHEDEIPAARRLFMTATPRTVSPELKTAGVGASMDDEQLFGRVAHRISFRDAINLGILADYRIHVYGVPCDDPRAAALIRRRAYVLDTGNAERPFDAGEIAQALALAQAFERRLFQYAFTFHSRVSYARRFIAATEHVWRPELREQTAFAVVTGEQPLRERRAILDRVLARPHGLIGSVKALSEGVDVPAVDAVVFADPKESVIDIVQAIGRALRKRPGAARKTASIVLPVPVPRDADPSQVLNDSAWRTIWNVIEAMAEHDGELEEHLAVLCTELGERRTSAKAKPALDRARQYLAEHVTVHLPDGHRFDVLRKAVTLAVVDRGTWAFWHMLDVFREWTEEHGDDPVPSYYRASAGERLAAWISDMRGKYRAGVLPEAQASILEATPHWYWDAEAQTWYRELRLLTSFVASHGRLPLHILDVDPESAARTAWVERQRDLLLTGGVPAKRQTALHAVPGWSDAPSAAELELHATSAEAFIAGDAAFRAFVAEMHQARRDAAHRLRPEWEADAIRARIQEWIKAQRTRWRDGVLDATSVTRLGSIPGWVWDPRAAKSAERAAQQEALMADLAVYAKEHGGVPGAVDGPSASPQLKRWISSVRASYRDGRLDPAVAAFCEDLPGWEWIPGLEAFKQDVDVVRAYANDYPGGWLPPDLVTPGGFAVGEWVASQRNLAARDRLSAPFRMLLEAVPGWQWKDGENFARNVEAMRRAVAANSTIDLTYPISVTIGGETYDLGAWVGRMGTAYHRGRLTEQQVLFLESFPGWRWDRLSDAQEARLRELGSALERVESLRDIAAGDTSTGSVGAWLRQQRRLCVEGRLPEGLAARLDAIAGWAEFVEEMGDERPRTNHRSWRSKKSRLEPIEVDSAQWYDALCASRVVALSRTAVIDVRQRVENDRTGTGVTALGGGLLVTRYVGEGLPDYGIVWRVVTERPRVSPALNATSDAESRHRELREILCALSAEGALLVTREEDTEGTTRTPGVLVTEWWIQDEWLPARYESPRELIDRGIALSERISALMDKAFTEEAPEPGALDVA